MENIEITPDIQAELLERLIRNNQKLETKVGELEARVLELETLLEQLTESMAGDLPSEEIPETTNESPTGTELTLEQILDEFPTRTVKPRLVKKAN